MPEVARRLAMVSASIAGSFRHASSPVFGLMSFFATANGQVKVLDYRRGGRINSMRAKMISHPFDPSVIRDNTRLSNFGPAEREVGQLGSRTVERFVQLSTMSTLAELFSAQRRTFPIWSSVFFLENFLVKRSWTVGQTAQPRAFRPSNISNLDVREVGQVGRAHARSGNRAIR
jgi:hypothetical protein